MTANDAIPPAARAAHDQAAATLPWEAIDHEHADHADFVRVTGRCFATADHDCPGRRDHAAADHRPGAA